MHSRRLRLIGSLLAVLALAALLPPSSEAQSNRLCFDVPGITDCIEGRFRQYWEANGGLAVFGYPIGPAANRTSAEGTFLTQDFERNRFESHPENAAPYDVLLGRLGDDLLRAQGLNWQSFRRALPIQDQNCRYFPETQHNVCDFDQDTGFRTYWERNGLADPALDAYGRSLALFGYPIGESSIETNPDGDTVITQWFERARFEWHPGNPAAFRVLLGRLGSETTRPLPPRGLPADVPWIAVAGRIVGAVPSQPTFTLPKGDAFAHYVASPDGSTLLADEQLVIGQGGFEFSRIVARTGERTRLLTTPNGVIAPQFSPDGRGVAFSTIEGNDWLLHAMDVASGSDLVVARGSLDGRVLVPQAWTARGIFVGETLWGSDAPLSNLQVVDPATSARQVVYAGSFLTATPTPDGARVAVLTGDPGMGGTPDLTILGIEADTGTITTLASGVDISVSRMAWSPDTTRLLYTTMNYAGGDSSLYVVSADGVNRNRLIFPPFGDGSRTLQDAGWRDSTTLLVVAANERILNVYTLPADTLRLELLASEATIAEQAFLGQNARIIYLP